MMTHMPNDRSLCPCGRGPLATFYSTPAIESGELAEGFTFSLHQVIACDVGSCEQCWNEAREHDEDDAA